MESSKLMTVNTPLVLKSKAEVGTSFKYRYDFLEYVMRIKYIYIFFFMLVFTFS